jgi:transcriptional regulator with XRE-family HTH domain
MSTTSTDIFRENVVFMMAHHDISFQDISRMPNVDISASYLRQVIKGEARSPTLEKLDVLAKLLKVPPYQLIQKGLPENVAHAAAIGAVIEDYLSATAEGKAAIELTAKAVSNKTE